MAAYQILYWQEIPSLVKAEDGHDEVSLPLPSRFLEHIDAVAEARDLQDADGYLDQWHWSDLQQRDGSAQEVATAVVAELDRQADW